MSDERDESASSVEESQVEGEDARGGTTMSDTRGGGRGGNASPVRESMESAQEASSSSAEGGVPRAPDPHGGGKGGNV